MFVEFFDFFCQALNSVFEVMKKFILFENFSYFNFCIGLFAIPIFIKIFNFIMQIEDDESYYNQSTYTSNYTPQYDGYTPRHYKTYKPRHSTYEPRHERKKRSWF